jgi:hypothetical protein
MPDTAVPLAAGACVAASAVYAADVEGARAHDPHTHVRAGLTTTLITCVDTDTHTLHTAWLVCANVHPAIITRTFQVTITLPMDRPLNKVRMSPA